MTKREVHYRKVLKRSIEKYSDKDLKELEVLLNRLEARMGCKPKYKEILEEEVTRRAI